MDDINQITSLKMEKGKFKRQVEVLKKQVTDFREETKTMANQQVAGAVK